MKLSRWILAAFGWAKMTTHLGGAEAVEHDGARHHLFPGRFLATRLRDEIGGECDRRLRRLDGKSAIEKVPHELKPILEVIDATNS
jgi:hypothetical protein